MVSSLGGWAPLIPAGFHVSRRTWDTGRVAWGLGYGAFTRYGRLFQTVRLLFANPSAYTGSARRPHDPLHATACPYTCKVWALAVSLAATKAIAFAFFSSGYLDVSVPPVPVTRLCVQRGTIRRSPDRSLATAPRSLSQLTRVLPRLLAPRHPPYALSNLIATLSISIQRAKRQSATLFRSDFIADKWCRDTKLHLTTCQNFGLAFSFQRTRNGMHPFRLNSRCRPPQKIRPITVMVGRKSTTSKI